MQQLADRVIACRQPGQSMEIDLACNGVQITGWLPQVQPDGLLRWRPSLLSVAQGMQLWLEHLVYCASGGNGESRLFLRKDGEWRFPPLAAEQALHYLSQLIEGYREGMSAPLLVLPESGGAWLKPVMTRKTMPCWMTIPRCKSPYEIPSGLRRQHDGAWRR